MSSRRDRSHSMLQAKSISPPRTQMTMDSQHTSSQSSWRTTTTPPSSTDCSIDSTSEQDPETKDLPRLLPACYLVHSLFKGKRRIGSPAGVPVAAQRCGELDICSQGLIIAKSAEPPSFPLKQEHSALDLQNWLLIHYSDDRPADFITTSSFPATLLLATLQRTITEIRAVDAHIRSLLEYASRPPYNRRIHIYVEDACRCLRINLLLLAREKREVIEQEVVQAARDLDFLRTKVAKVRQMVVEAKKSAACKGVWAEVRDLLRLGVVDERWVRRYCEIW